MNRMHRLKRIKVEDTKRDPIEAIEIGQSERRNYGYRIVWKKDGQTSAWFEGYISSEAAEKAGMAWV